MKPPLILTTLLIFVVVFLGICTPFNIFSFSTEVSDVVMIGGNSLMPLSPPPQGFQVLGTMVSDELYYIVKCESDFNPEVCNKEFGCSSGMGLCQLIPSTVKHCEEKLGKRIDPFNSEDNLECGEWLLKNEGSHHWGTAETVGKWGSYECFKDYLFK